MNAENFSYSINTLENVPKFIQDNLTCSICKNLFTTPITLLCQHTFCRECLIEWQRRTINGIFDSFLVNLSSRTLSLTQLNTFPVKCPECKMRIFIPPRKLQNFTLQRIIEALVTNKVELQRFNIKYSLEDEIKEELRMELTNGVLNNLHLVEAKITQNETPNRSGVTNQLIVMACILIATIKYMFF